MAVGQDLSNQLARLAGRWDGRSRRLVSATAEVEIGDPVGAVVAARLATDRWFAWEEPERGFALAGVGSAAEVISRGADRFGDVSADCARILRDRIADEPTDLPAGAGPVWTGGFAFGDEGGSSGPWSSLPPALFVLPELSLVREDEQTFLTACVLLEPGPEAPEALAGVVSRIAVLAGRDLPMLDPAASGRVEVSSTLPPSHYEDAVAQAVERIRGGELSKVVLAREVRA